MKKLLLFVCCLAFVSFISCSEDDEKFKLTVHMEKTGADGFTAYAKLCDEGSDFDCTAKYRGSAVFSGTQATLTIDDVEEGTYSAGIFVDMNNNNSTSYIPDCTDDYATGDDSVKIDEDINETILDSDWDGPGGFDWCP